MVNAKLSAFLIPLCASYNLVHYRQYGSGFLFLKNQFMYNYFKLSEQRKKNYMMDYEKVNREMVCI